MKSKIMAICAALLLAGAAIGGFVEGTGAIATAQEAKGMSDNAFVTLRGRIDRRLGSDEYVFQDESGTIVVEIDDEEWFGMTVTPDTPIEISGAVERGWFSGVKVDVHRVSKSCE